MIGGDQYPAYVADQLDVPLSDVYESFSYCYSHVDEMRVLELENGESFERAREPSLHPKGPIR